MGAFISLQGTTGKGRRQVAQAQSFNVTEVTEPDRLTDLLRKLERRVSELEARQVPDYAEYEVNLGTAAALTKLTHGFNCPVRFSVVHWTKVTGGAYPTAAPVLVVDDTSTDSVLVLRSHVAGRAVIRVERSQHGLMRI